MIKKTKEDLDGFFKSIKIKRAKSNVGPSTDEYGVLTLDSKHMDDTLNRNSTSVYTAEKKQEGFLCETIFIGKSKPMKLEPYKDKR